MCPTSLGLLVKVWSGPSYMASTRVSSPQVVYLGEMRAPYIVGPQLFLLGLIRVTLILATAWASLLPAGTRDPFSLQLGYLLPLGVGLTRSGSKLDHEVLLME
jgi:hypothetical protein